MTYLYINRISGHYPILTRDISKVKTDEIFKKFIRGKNINRYEINFSGEYVLYDKSLLYSARDEDIFKVKEKIVIRETADKPIGMYDDSRFYNQNTVHNIRLLKDSQYDLKYILTLLNSKIATYYYQKVVPDLRGVFNKVKIQDLINLPIPRITFTTPAAERIRTAGEAKKMYAVPYFAELMILIDDCLPKDASGNLITDKEKSDVVHDVLVFLAEQMIAMNREIQTEVRRFLDWVESRFHVDLEELSNRTVLMGYYKHDFEKFYSALKKNKNHIPNIRDENVKQDLLAKFQKSMGTIEPFLDKIKSTDDLIDQIVYKLYCLTDEEIKIVENGVRGR